MAEKIQINRRAVVIKILLGLPLILLVLTYVVGAMGSVFIVSVLIFITFWALLTGLLMLFLGLILRLLSAHISSKAKGYGIKKTLFIAAVFIFFILLAVLFSRNKTKLIGPFQTDLLGSLPYAAWVPAQESMDKIGVTKYDPVLSYSGLNIFHAGGKTGTVAYLFDMTGKIVRKWLESPRLWHHVEMCGRSLLAAAENEALVKLNWNSDVEWISRGRFHHDIAVAENGNIYSLTRKEEVAFYRGLPVPVLIDYIIILSPDGKAKGEVSLNKVFRDQVSLRRIFQIYRWLCKPSTLRRVVQLKLREGFCFFGAPGDEADLLHANTVEIIDRDIDTICKKGDLLICALKLDLIGMLDLENEKLLWSWGPGDLDKPHQPTLLQNGNTLITESDKGHVFEVTRDGQIAWEFYNPKIRKKDKKRMAIYRMMRLSVSEVFPRLKEPE